MSAAIEFKLKYSGSALGYVWSIVKPLAYFAVLWVVFGRFFKLGTVFSKYPLYLIIGIVLWTFFVDATSLAMASLVARGGLLRKMAFPRLVVPVSATMVATVTFGINFVIVAVFLATSREAPHPGWLLVPLLLLELYAFTLGLSLILATLFVRFRDVGQLWELVTQLLFFATPIMYPFLYLPPWFQPVAMLNPFTQVTQDIRNIFIPDAPANTIPSASYVFRHDGLGFDGHVFPILVSVLVLAGGLLLFRREEPWVAERTG
jgi:ABC-2 type transport system permease protein